MGSGGRSDGTRKFYGEMSDLRPTLWGKKERERRKFSKGRVKKGVAKENKKAMGALMAGGKEFNPVEDRGRQGLLRGDAL